MSPLKGVGFNRYGTQRVVEYLVVAGGGGAGSPGSNIVGGGGGGAGGMIVGSGLTITNSAVITIGAGGSYGFAATNGGDSSITGITATGGGRGGGPYSGATLGAGGSGGSGGGSAQSANTGTDYAGGAGTSGQGYAGGTNVGNSAYGGSGANGGGAGGVGANGGTGANWTPAPVPTNGFSNNLSGSSVTYSTGGRAAPAWQTNQAGAAGVANSGNGGNAGIGTGQSQNGDAGIVIIRYPDSFPAAAATTGSPTYVVSGGYRRYIWTSSGSVTF